MSSPEFKNAINDQDSDLSSIEDYYENHPPPLGRVEIDLSSDTESEPSAPTTTNSFFDQRSTQRQAETPEYLKPKYNFRDDSSQGPSSDDVTVVVLRQDLTHCPSFAVLCASDKEERWVPGFQLDVMFTHRGSHDISSSFFESTSHGWPGFDKPRTIADNLVLRHMQSHSGDGRQQDSKGATVQAFHHTLIPLIAITWVYGDENSATDNDLTNLQRRNKAGSRRFGNASTRAHHDWNSTIYSSMRNQDRKECSVGEEPGAFVGVFPTVSTADESVHDAFEPGCIALRYLPSLCQKESADLGDTIFDDPFRGMTESARFAHPFYRMRQVLGFDYSCMIIQPVESTIPDPHDEERILILKCPNIQTRKIVFAKIQRALVSFYTALRRLHLERGLLSSAFLATAHPAHWQQLPSLSDDALLHACMRSVFHMHFMRRLFFHCAAKNEAFLQEHGRRPAQSDVETLVKLLKSPPIKDTGIEGIFNFFMKKARTMVSLKKRRFVGDSFNLDLAYVRPDIIAMGFPSTGKEALFRNPMQETVRHLETFHNPQGRYPVTVNTLRLSLDVAKAFERCSNEKADRGGTACISKYFITAPGQKNAAVAERFLLHDAQVVASFLTVSHVPNYRVFNLCSERCYAPSRLTGSFERFPSDDHHPAPFSTIVAFCVSAASFIHGGDFSIPGWAPFPHGIKPGRASAIQVVPLRTPDEMLCSLDRVVAIHCKAGKGRTGVMCVALLLFLGHFHASPSRAVDDNPLVAALNWYGINRTHNNKGVSIASQLQFLEYFQWYCESERERLSSLFSISESRNDVNATKMYPELLSPFAFPLFRFPHLLQPPPLPTATLRSIAFAPYPCVDLDGKCQPYFIIVVRVPNHTHRPLGQLEVATTEKETLHVVYDSRSVATGSVPPHINQTSTAYFSLREFPIKGEARFIFYAEQRQNSLLGGVKSVNKGAKNKDEYLFSFWIHSGFLQKQALSSQICVFSSEGRLPVTAVIPSRDVPIGTPPDESNIPLRHSIRPGVNGVLRLRREQLDGASKATRGLFDSSFVVSMDYSITV